MAAKFTVFGAALLAIFNCVFGFSGISISCIARSVGSGSGLGYARPLMTLRRGFQGLKMTVDSTVTKNEKGEKAPSAAQNGEPNLCDINTQLCDGDIHTAPLDLDIKIQAEPEKENMMAKVKATGISGLISYAAWEFVFWAVSAPAAVIMYHQTTGEWPNFSNPESTAKVSAVIFGFLNFARALVPVRIGLTLATVPLVDKYIVKPFGLGKSKSEPPAAPPSDTPQ